MNKRAAIRSLIVAGVFAAPAFASPAMATAATAAMATSHFEDALKKAAPVPEPFPVHLQGYRTGVRDGWNYPLASLTFKASVPGLSFCVTYSATHGAAIRPHDADFGHIYQGDLGTCLTAGRDGVVSDTVRVDPGKSPDALLIANIVLVDNRVSAETVPLATGSAASKR